MPWNVVGSVLSAFLMCFHGLGDAVSRAFNSVRGNGNSTHNYDTICNDTDSLVPSDSAAELEDANQRKTNLGSTSGRKKLSLFNRQKEDKADSRKPEKPPRPPDPKNIRDILRRAKPESPSNVDARGPTEGPRLELGVINLQPTKPNPPSKLAEEPRSDTRPVGRKLSDTRRKQLGNIIRPPARPDLPPSVGNRQANRHAFGNDVKVANQTDHGPNNQSGSAVKPPATIKLPKRRSSLQKHTQGKRTAVKSPVCESAGIKSPPSLPEDAEGNRIAALKQRLFEMQNMQKKESRKISIPISRSVGNVARKTRSFEDKLFGGEGLAPTLFPLFNKPKKNPVTIQGKPNLERSLSVGSCMYSSVKLEEFFNSRND